MPEDFDLLTKWIIPIVGAISLLFKLFESFSEIKRKKDLKADLELLERFSATDMDAAHKEVVRAQIKKTLNDYLKMMASPLRWYNIFYALTLFMGFGWWTVHLYRTNETFTPWAILTSLISFVGLAMLFDADWHQRDKQRVLITIRLHKGIGVGFVLLGTGMLTGFLLYNNYGGYTHWYFVALSILLLGSKTAFDSIHIERHSRSSRDSALDEKSLKETEGPEVRVSKF